MLDCYGEYDHEKQKKCPFWFIMDSISRKDPDILGIVSQSVKVKIVNTLMDLGSVTKHSISWSL